MRVRAMTAGDYATVSELWQAAEGVRLSGADSEAGIAAFLARNPGLSLVAETGGAIVGTVLCGHDGRRGYIHHLAVAPPHRRRGVAGEMVARCLDALAAQGIQKCHAFVLADNTDALAFWRRQDWTRRTELTVVSRLTDAPGRH